MTIRDELDAIKAGMARALAEQDAKRFAAYYTDDARLLSQGQPIIRGSSRDRGRGPGLGHERVAHPPVRDRRRDRRRVARRGRGPDRQPDWAEQVRRRLPAPAGRESQGRG